MRNIVFGASGMVGSGVLGECLRAQDVETVLAIGRAPLGLQHPRLQELVLADLFDYTGHEAELRGFDACFFCLGTSAAGKSEAEYRRISHDLTLAAARVLARLNPQMVFIYVSGTGTDSTERGRSMWARVKGETENALRRLPFKAVYLFRPGLIRPMDGAVSKTPGYRLFYTLLAPLVTLAHRAFPNHVLSTREIGQAMLQLMRKPGGSAVCETRDIRRAVPVA